MGQENNLNTLHTQLLPVPKAFGRPYFPSLFVVHLELLPGRQGPRMQQQGHSAVHSWPQCPEGDIRPEAILSRALVALAPPGTTK